jgi:hypothetical protein
MLELRGSAVQLWNWKWAQLKLNGKAS